MVRRKPLFLATLAQTIRCRWSGAAAFPASPHCARKGRDTPRANGTHKADEVCAAPRAVSFPKCNLTVVRRGSLYWAPKARLLLL